MKNNNPVRFGKALRWSGENSLGQLQLGHVSLSTTNIYAEIDLEMKAKALAICQVTEEPSQHKHWRDQPSLMEFLRTL